MTNQAHTKEFFDLIRNIGETKSKQVRVLNYAQFTIFIGGG
jgi:hypothetical protein